MPDVAIERQLNPLPWYATMRQASPVYYDPRRWCWNVFQHDDVLRVLSDYGTFSSQFHGIHYCLGAPQYAGR